MSAERRWPWAEAHAVAQELLQEIEPFVERVQLAGSLRRRRPDVGDIEVLFIPKIAMLGNPDSLLGELVPVNLAERRIARLEKSGVLARRKNVNGGEAMGPKNKLMVHAASGIPVDLFTATAENWFNYLVCRTGGAENNVQIATAAQRRGWKWNPYGAGFSRGDEVVAMQSESAVFEFVRLSYRRPEERR